MFDICVAKDETTDKSYLEDAVFGKKKTDDDDLGKITFEGFDPNGNQHTFAQALGEIAVAADGSEEGRLTFSVASHDAELQPGLILASGNAEDEVDVTIGNTATSVTTIAGTLTMGSTATLDNSGNLLTNAATATALTSGNKTISGTLDVTGNLQFSSTDGGAVSILDSQEDAAVSFIDGGGFCFFYKRSWQKTCW